MAEEWVREVDFSTCETLDKSFVADNYKNTESDLIYRAQLKSGDEEIYIFILLEFQSTVDVWMPLRMLNYITNFYMDYLASTKTVNALPPVFPLMLYNGDQVWNAGTKMSDIIKDHEILGKFGIGFEYFKLAENEISKEKLLKIKNIVSTLFLAESHYNLELLERELLAVFDREADKQAVSLLINWFKQMAVHRRIKPKDYEKMETLYKTHEEVKSMLVTALEKERKELIEKGRIEGVNKGVEKEKIKTALKMVQEGFSVEMISKITGLATDTIERLKQQ